jgi:glycosyltransferase involved in cell wall biosynthesis
MEPILTISVCSLYRREAFLKRLKNCLAPQLPKDNSVEVLCSIDNGESHISIKRNTLLHAAKGRWVCSIDDDDLVHPEYISKILDALKQDPDTVGFSLIMTVDDKNPERSYHSIKYKTWFDKPNEKNPTKNDYFRNPNHLNPVRREIAQQIGFKNNTLTGDDYSDRYYSAGILPMLKTEVYIDEPPMYYYLVRSEKYAI